jgi:hypothetical protein
MRRPILGSLPRLDMVTVGRRDRQFALPYLYRSGTGRGTILFVHGLGGSKENLYLALQILAVEARQVGQFRRPRTSSGLRTHCGAGS